MNIPEYLEERKIRKADFARMFQVEKSTVSHWVNGRRCPSPEMATYLERRSGGAITIEDLIKYHQALKKKNKKY